MDICLALGGGGIKGIAHIGVLECLEKAGYTIRAIAGTSAGGLVGAVYAAGYSPAEILTFLESIPKSRLYARQPNDGPSLLGIHGLAEGLTDILGNSQFKDLKIPFACTAVDMHASREVFLEQGSVVDAVLATIAIPGVFPPRVIGDCELIDGGVLNPVPVNLARYLAQKLEPRMPVIAVALNPQEEEWRHIPQINSIPPMPLPIPIPLVEGFARMRLGQSLRIFMHSIDISAHMLTELRLKVDKPDVITRPDVSNYALLDTVFPRELVQVGYLAAEHALPQIEKALAWPQSMRRWLQQYTDHDRRPAASRPVRKRSSVTRSDSEAAKLKTDSK